MSRIGKQSIEIPKGVTIQITPDLVTAKGPKGTLTLHRHEAIEIKQEQNELVFVRTSEDKPTRAAHGLMRALTNNLVTGVTKGFERTLEINEGYARLQSDLARLVQILATFVRERTRR